MVSGPENYKEAERLAGQLAEGAVDWEPIAATAQVHATLALAAATALGAAASVTPGDAVVKRELGAWREAASTPWRSVSEVADRG